MPASALPGLDAETPAIQPLDRAETIPSSWYVDPLFHRFDIAEDIAFSDRVQQEDVEICEHVQPGHASRAYDRGSSRSRWGAAPTTSSAC
jgi:hypothetical protein